MPRSIKKKYRNLFRIFADDNDAGGDIGGDAGGIEDPLGDEGDDLFGGDDEGGDFGSPGGGGAAGGFGGGGEEGDDTGFEMGDTASEEIDPVLDYINSQKPNIHYLKQNIFQLLKNDKLEHKQPTTARDKEKYLLDIEKALLRHTPWPEKGFKEMLGNIGSSLLYTFLSDEISSFKDKNRIKPLDRDEKDYLDVMQEKNIEAPAPALLENGEDTGEGGDEENALFSKNVSSKKSKNTNLFSKGANLNQPLQGEFSIMEKKFTIKANKDGNKEVVENEKDKKQEEEEGKEKEASTAIAVAEKPQSKIKIITNKIKLSSRKLEEKLKKANNAMNGLKSIVFAMEGMGGPMGYAKEDMGEAGGLDEGMDTGLDEGGEDDLGLGDDMGMEMGENEVGEDAALDQIQIAQDALDSAETALSDASADVGAGEDMAAAPVEIGEDEEGEEQIGELEELDRAAKTGRGLIRKAHKILQAGEKLPKVIEKRLAAIKKRKTRKASDAQESNTRETEKENLENPVNSPDGDPITKGEKEEYPGHGSAVGKSGHNKSFLASFKEAGKKANAFPKDEEFEKHLASMSAKEIHALNEEQIKAILNYGPLPIAKMAQEAVDALVDKTVPVALKVANEKGENKSANQYPFTNIEQTSKVMDPQGYNDYLAQDGDLGRGFKSENTGFNQDSASNPMLNYEDGSLAKPEGSHEPAGIHRHAGMNLPIKLHVRKAAETAFEEQFKNLIPNPLAIRIASELIGLGVSENVAIEKTFNILAESFEASTKVALKRAFQYADLSEEDLLNRAKDVASVKVSLFDEESGAVETKTASVHPTQMPMLRSPATDAGTDANLESIFNRMVR